MKRMIKLTALAALTLMVTASCIEIAAGTAVVAGASYLANNGMIETHLEMKSQDAYLAANKYLQQRQAFISHSSSVKTQVNADIVRGDAVTFKFTKITTNTCRLDLTATRKGILSNDLAHTVYNEFLSSLN